MRDFGFITPPPVYKKHVKTINTVSFKDSKLSWKARGILAYILSLPPGWKGQIYHLQTMSDSDGIKSLRAGLRELVANGYAELKTHPKEDGKFKGKFYIFFDEKQTKISL